MYPDLNPTLTRCEYRIKPWKKALSLLLGVPLTVAGLFVAATSRFGQDKITAGISCLFFLAAGVYLLAWAFRSRLVLDGTRIEVRTAFGERTADLHEIEGFRTISTRYGSIKRLQLKNGAGAISVSNDFETYGDFRAWINKLPDLDGIDRTSLLDEIKSREDLGATPEERLGALRTARTIAIFALVVVVTLALVLSFADPVLQLPAGTVLAFSPVAVLVLMRRSPLLYTIFKRKADPRADLAFVLIVTSFGFLLASRDVHLVSVRNLLPIMALLAALFLAPIFLPKRSDNAMLMSRVIGLVFFAGLYGYALTLASDSLLDGSYPAPYRASVIQKHEYHGRSTSYMLYLAPWGPFAERNRLSVTSHFYHRTEIGDQVCLDLYPGSLHAQWFRQVDCATQRGPISPR
jgi:hypothetical protein